MSSLLECKNLSVAYGGIQALRNLSFSVKTGEILCVIGCNGAGKTTTLWAISGLVPLKSGSIHFNGEEISAWSQQKPHQLAKLGMAHVPEGRGIFPELSVEENLELGTWGQNNKKLIADNLERVFQYFPRILERRKQMAGTLSGGEQQMLAIGRALMMNPKFVLLDEPSLGLAPQIIALIFKIVQEINKAGTTILLVEQNAHLALGIAHRGIVLETGELSLIDEAQKLLHNPKVREAYLGGHA